MNDLAIELPGLGPGADFDFLQKLESLRELVAPRRTEQAHDRDREPPPPLTSSKAAPPKRRATKKAAPKKR